MSKGDDLWDKREKLLRYLYDQGAIAADAACNSNSAAQAIEADPHDMIALVSNLHDEGVLRGQAGAAGLLYLTGPGFARARDLVESQRRPMV